MPDFKLEIRARLAELHLSPVREAEIVEEVSQHLEQEYERAVSGGASAEEARQQALDQLKAPDL
ncbi:MAG TPA: permease prefix domain 1-containing protein, partial [Candidatus Udaeobacter sp.]